MDPLQKDKEMVRTVTVPASETKADPLEKMPDPMEVPDGGFEAWRTVAGAWLVLLGTFGYSYTFGVYEDFYVREYLSNHTPSSIAQLSTNDAFLSWAFCGEGFDDGGFHAIEIIGGIIFTFSVFMLSLAKPGQYYQIFLAQGVGMGIGLGLTFLPTISIVVHHFKRRRGLTSGIVLSGSSVGATFFPIMLNHLLPKLGFAKAIRATGAIVPPCLVVGNLLMRTRLPPRSKRPNAKSPDIKSFFGDAAYMWGVVGTFVSLLGLYFPVIYIQLFSIQHNVDSKLAFYSVAMLNASGAFVRILGNHLADLYGPFNVQMLCSFAAARSSGRCSAFNVIMNSVSRHDGASLIVVSLLYGALSGAWLSLCFACFASLARGPEKSGSNSPAPPHVEITPVQSSARAGLALALCSMGTLVSAPIQGALLTDRFVWLNPVGFAGVGVLRILFVWWCVLTLGGTGDGVRWRVLFSGYTDLARQGDGELEGVAQRLI
ncbi:major facilitator superfamily domain-containing protein [Mycena sp. CBHHK59/15]|nr:major facilitator superfamily domain-containing protein [Mycena sp. CBHHK59/15]